MKTRGIPRDGYNEKTNPDRSNTATWRRPNNGAVVLVLAGTTPLPHF